jgi:hypothetical protein
MELTLEKLKRTAVGSERKNGEIYFKRQTMRALFKS